MLIDGHLRADVSPDAEWPVLVLDVDEAEAGTLLATLDPLADMAEADPAKLDALLRDVETGSQELAAMLEKLAEEAGIVPTEPPTDFAEVDENIETEHTCPKCGYQWSGGE
jgi:nucleotide-binding universal stress UspA family protein